LVYRRWTTPCTAAGSLRGPPTSSIHQSKPHLTVLHETYGPAAVHPWYVNGREHRSVNIQQTSINRSPIPTYRAIIRDSPPFWSMYHRWSTPWCTGLLLTIRTEPVHCPYLHGPKPPTTSRTDHGPTSGYTTESTKGPVQGHPWLTQNRSIQVRYAHQSGIKPTSSLASRPWTTFGTTPLVGCLDLTRVGRRVGAHRTEKYTSVTVPR